MLSLALAVAEFLASSLSLACVLRLMRGHVLDAAV
jgi:hypothetical protein